MAYKSLYRTYRPQTFKDVAGQEAIITTLKHAIDEKKIAHAYLFCGPRGTGKTTVAKLLAKAVNCTGDPKPCGECENCKQIENGTHPDVIEIDAASNNGVEEVRSLIDKVKYAPTQGQYKVYIIDEVHMMSPGAFNALLKTLEEPPENVIFIDDSEKFFIEKLYNWGELELKWNEFKETIKNSGEYMAQFIGDIDYIKVNSNKLILKVKNKFTKNNLM